MGYDKYHFWEIMTLLSEILEKYVWLTLLTRLLLCFFCLRSHSLNEYGLGLALVMKFAVDEINANQSLLPGFKLGYQIYDTCSEPSIIVKPTIALLTGKSNKALSVECNYTNYETEMVAVIGPQSSELVSVIGKLLGFFLMPQVWLQIYLVICSHTFSSCSDFTFPQILMLKVKLNICPYSVNQKDFF